MRALLVKKQLLKASETKQNLLFENIRGNVRLAEYNQEIRRVMNTERGQGGWQQHIEKICCDYFSNDYNPQYEQFNMLMSDIYYAAYIERNNLDKDTPLENVPPTLKNINMNLKKCTSGDDNNYQTSGIKSIPAVVRNKVEKLMANAIDEGRFCMRIPARSGIFHDISNSHFKNILETYKSGDTDNNARYRAAISKVILGCSDNITAKDREKYGYLSVSDDFNHEREKGTDMFGAVRVIFKKENVRDRTTLTLGDSGLNYEGLVASRVSQPKVESIPGVIDKNPLLLAIIYSLEKLDLNHHDVQHHHGKSPAFKEDTNDAGEQWFNKICKASDNGESFDGWMYPKDWFATIDYIELQYHGKLTMDDVEQIEVDHSEKTCPEGEKTFKQIEAILKNKGVKVVYKGTE